MAEQTPMEITGLPYGENQEANAVAQSMPLDAAEQPEAPVPLSAPSQRPEEPETEGSPFGPGSNILPSTEVSKGLPTETRLDDGLLEALMAAYQQNPTPEIANLVRRHLSGTQ